MKLTGEMLQQIIKSLRSDKAQGGSERRRAPRVGIRACMSVLFAVPDCHGKKDAEVWVRDVAAGGIGLLMSRALEPGSCFAAVLPCDKNIPMTVVYRIVYCRSLAKELFSVGARMERILTDEETASHPHLK